MKCQSGVDREAQRGISALFDENAQALRLAALHFLGVLAALLRRLLCSATHKRNASSKVCELVRAILLVVLHGSHGSHHQQTHHKAKHHHLLASPHFVFPPLYTFSLPLSLRRLAPLCGLAWVFIGLVKVGTYEILEAICRHIDEGGVVIDEGYSNLMAQLVNVYHDRLVKTGRSNWGFSCCLYRA